MTDDGLDVLEGLAEELALGVERAAEVLGELLNLTGDVLEGLALVPDDLAEEEVEPLDRRRAFVEGVDLGVPDVLLDRVVLQEAGAAEGLQRLGAEQDPGPFRPQALDDRQEQVAHPAGELGVGALLDHDGTVSVLGLGDRVELGRRVQDERAQPLGVGLLEHERAADVGVVGDRDARSRLVGHLRQVCALDALLGILERVEVAGGERRDGLGPDEHARVLDDVEHLGDAVVDVAEERADGGLLVAEGHLARGADLEPHLVLDVRDVGAVALTQLTRLEVDVELRHDEEREPLGPGAGTLRPGEDEVDDVVDEVGLRRGDEALHALDVPRAVGLLDRLGPSGADVRAGVRLGEDHGCVPGLVDDVLGQLLLVVGAQVVEQVRERVARGVHVHGRVGAADHLGGRPAQ